MSARPRNLDLSGANNAPSPSLTSPQNRFHLDLPSPRAGEVPPALSPLDAFAQHSRMLARKFEESQQKGRRISRLDHLEVAQQLGSRPSYFRVVSGESEREHEAGQGQRGLVTGAPQNSTENNSRPISHYPHLSHMSSVADRSNRSTVTQDVWFETEDTEVPQPVDNYFGIQVPRASSPEPYEPKSEVNEKPLPIVPSLTSSIDSFNSSQPRTNTDESSRSRGFGRGLAPPTSPHHPRGNKSAISIRSVIDSADEDTDELIPPRKFSASSGMSRPKSPMTPDTFPTPHSPSVMSDRSADTGHFQRPSFNFSRPLSSSSNKGFSEGRPSLSSKPSYESRPSFEFPPRQSSIDQSRSPFRKASGSSTMSEMHTRQTHLRDARADTGFEMGDESAPAPTTPGAPSYIYAKYSLPRGRVIERGSLGARDSWMQHQFKWDEPQGNNEKRRPDISRAETEQRSRPIKQTLELHNTTRSRSAEGQGRSSSRTPFHKSNPSSPSITSDSTDRTIRAHSRNSPSADIVNLSAEQHLEKGIECHSNGSLSKSTYHLRLSAKAGNPTAMLLYALACRHGWGMRENQAEGVQWLKKAVDSSSLEMMADGTAPLAAAPGRGDKTRQAQFALAIYELGTSYMHGWGTPKDKSLALRCFEVAGNWGDCDALAEAGFCYAQGSGCKKDLKKAAALYRRAAEGGMSMAGNSWIYKEKYMDEAIAPPSAPYANSPNPSNSDKSTKSVSSRSRARSLFGRKKTVTAS